MNDKTFFAPQLFIKSGVRDIDFYVKAFGAAVLRSWLNDDGSIHVAELSINGTLFHLHEESASKGLVSPLNHNQSTVIMGLFVPDVDTIMKNSIAAGATEYLLQKIMSMDTAREK
jgi:PhnB protein